MSINLSMIHYESGGARADCKCYLRITSMFRSYVICTLASEAIVFFSFPVHSWFTLLTPSLPPCCRCDSTYWLSETTIKLLTQTLPGLKSSPCLRLLQNPQCSLCSKLYIEFCLSFTAFKPPQENMSDLLQLQLPKMLKVHVAQFGRGLEHGLWCLCWS